MLESPLLISDTFMWFHRKTMDGMTCPSYPINISESGLKLAHVLWSYNALTDSWLSGGAAAKECGRNSKQSLYMWLSP